MCDFLKGEGVKFSTVFDYIKFLTTLNSLFLFKNKIILYWEVEQIILRACSYMSI